MPRVRALPRLRRVQRRVGQGRRARRPEVDHGRGGNDVRGASVRGGRRRGWVRLRRRVGPRSMRVLRERTARKEDERRGIAGGPYTRSD